MLRTKNTSVILQFLLLGLFSFSAAFGAGELDLSFNTVVSPDGAVRKLAVQPDGKILVGGYYREINSIPRNSLARLNADGSLDQTFIPYFNTFVQQNVYDIVIQPDGKILVGFGFGPVLARLNPDGSRDITFNSNLQTDSSVTDIALQPDGKILIAGSYSFIPGNEDFAIARLNPNGSIDPTYNRIQISFSQEWIYRCLLQPDGKILVAGRFTTISGVTRRRIARLNSDGTLDQTFIPPTGTNAPVNSIALQPDGKVILGGEFTTLDGSNGQVRIGRLNSNGSLDSSFTQNLNDTVYTIKLQPDGKILTGGVFTYVGEVLHQEIARLNPNGSLDLSFNGVAGGGGVLDVDLQADGKVLIGGTFVAANSVPRIKIARFLNTSLKQFDYDGDGRADISVFRPSENKWYILRSSDNQITQPIFAIAGDIPAPADYDGDGKTDVAIFRPSTGDWWYLSSINNAQVQNHWGQAGDIPRPSDFDGDGKADFVLFRPAENNWYWFGSLGGVSIVNFGLAGDKPVAGDFDGDGKSDAAIYRPSTGTWWYRSSITAAQIATQFGIDTDIPAPADFDGDGKTDFAVYRASSGTWYVLNSSNGQATIVNFGLSADKPIAADYDGDGKADIAVFRPSTGIWYLLRSTAGFTALQFGVATDIPTPNAFVP